MDSADNPNVARSDPEITVVGIGASAGGLAALKKLFGSMPADTGFAFVVVMHLAPDAESSLAGLLQLATEVKVQQVVEDTHLSPNVVYVIPPNRNISMIDSHLRLSPLEEKRRDRAPIDHFLMTLAKSHRDRAIGIILTGTGGDGALGLSQIKQAAGIAIAQDPKDAEFDGMPQSAISTGLVDFVLDLDRIRERVVKLAKVEPKLSVAGQQEALSADDQRLLDKILAQVQIHCGHDFSRYKVTTITRRVRRRMHITGAVELSDYLQLLRQSEQEVRDLFDDLLITVTNFFRDAEVFEVLEKKVVPDIFKDKGPNDCVRVWVNGCASGEEAYTMAMLLMDQAGSIANPPAIQVIASDLHQKSLMRAREGRYPDTISGDVPADRLERFFDQEKSGGYRIKKSVRERVVFAPHNVMSDPPFSRMDLVSCRNVMIYFKRDVQQDLIDLFDYALNPGGYLVLGTAETINPSSGEFQVFDKALSIYRKSNARTPKKLPNLSMAMVGVNRGIGERQRKHGPRYSYGGIHQQVVEQFAPPSMLVNQDHDIVHYSQHAGRYLIQPGGEPTNNVFKRVAEPLRVELRAAVFAAQRDGIAKRAKPVRLVIDGETREVIIRVQVPKGKDSERFYLVIFDEQEPAESGVLPSDDLDASHANIRELETELELTNKRMQEVIEEYETSQEEMRASNEEIQSSNEELRSTMEELETSKEELQSMNEELSAANQENRHKVEELSEMTSDLQNLLAATDIATLFLDRQLRIQRFTPKVGELINVLQSDCGRPLADFTHRLGYSELTSDAKVVLAKLQPVERELQAEDGHWYLLRLMPYRNMEDRIDGVVITLVDISEIKQSSQKLELLTRTLEKRVQQSTEQVRLLASKLALAEQMERSRIAQILHDDLQQIIYSAQLRLRFLFEDEKIGEDKSGEIFSELKRAIDLARDLSVDLSPPILNTEGLKESLQWLRNQTKRLHNIDVSLNMSKDVDETDKDIRMLIFQIGRELLFNVAKHADTDKASIEIRKEAGSVKMTVSDRGRGFSKERFQSGDRETSGFGLGSISERLELLGGSCSISSSPGEGTAVTVEVPCERKGAGAEEIEETLV